METSRTDWIGGVGPLELSDARRALAARVPARGGAQRPHRHARKLGFALGLPAGELMAGQRVALPSMAVNVSALQFKAPHALENEIIAALDETGLPPATLEIEMTETALMGTLSGHDNVIERLRARGLRIAIDDFGTGYSSAALSSALSGRSDQNRPGIRQGYRNRTQRYGDAKWGIADEGGGGSSSSYAQITQNTISNCGSGVAIDNGASLPYVLISGNTLTNCNIGGGSGGSIYLVAQHHTA